MNKDLSQAIKKAVSDFKPKIEIKDKNKGPDLFSLNDNTEPVSYTHLTLPTTPYV